MNRMRIVLLGALLVAGTVSTADAQISTREQ